MKEAERSEPYWMQVNKECKWEKLFYFHPQSFIQHANGFRLEIYFSIKSASAQSVYVDKSFSTVGVCDESGWDQLANHFKIQ